MSKKTLNKLLDDYEASLEEFEEQVRLHEAKLARSKPTTPAFDLSKGKTLSPHRDNEPSRPQTSSPGSKKR